jgi:hypothetical protein
VASEVTGSTARDAVSWLRRAGAALLGAVRDNKLFTGALAIGALIRLVTILGYPGALWFAGDSYVYLGAALRPQANLSKSTGYSLFLRLLLPFHSLTLVVALQHLMGLADAVLIYALLRHSKVSKKWATVASLPMLLDSFVIEDEHLVMTEALFTFLLLAGLAIVLWKPRLAWWKALIVGLLIGYAAIVRTDGVIVLVIFPLFVLIRGWGWKTVSGWVSAIVMCVGILVPVGAYATWFHSEWGHWNVTMTDGFYLWGRTSSFANCAIIKPTGEEAKVCPSEPFSQRTPPGDFIWHAKEVHGNLDSVGGPTSAAANSLLTDFAITAVEKQPLSYVKAVVKGTLLAFEYPRTDYPDVGTVYYYYFHTAYAPSVLPPTAADKTKSSWIPGGTAYGDWLSYGRQRPGAVNPSFDYLMVDYQRYVYTWGPLLAVIFVLGLGGVITVRRRRWRPTTLRWQVRGTSMLPWITAVGLLLFPIASADFDYRYLIPVLPFACIAAGLAFAPRSRRWTPGPPSSGSEGAEAEPAVPGSVA